MTLINGTTQLSGTTTSSQLLVSSFEKPIVLTMIGSAAIANAINNSIESTEMANGIINETNFQSNITPMQTNNLSALTAETLCYSNANSNQECVLSVINEETTQMDSNILNTTTMQNELSPTFSPISEVSLENTTQDREQNIVSNNDFKSESLIINSNTEPVTSLPESQYLSLNSFNTIPSNHINSIILNSPLEPAVSSPPLTDIPSVPLNCDPINNLLEQMPATHLIPSSMSTITSETVLTLTDSMATALTSNATVAAESVPIKSLISDNPVLTSAATTTQVTQASNISALSEMSDAELLCFINPAAFDQSMCSYNLLLNYC